ncbi:polysaccharide deacetylase family protein [Bosea sp. RAF48]|uniref:polysaccharide deacetylase family protein n=1 Tax=Bosea sp. RAF48 TaxID=3237480 RepID=UPI003F912953
MNETHWQALSRELDNWQAAGRQLRLWLRDDDAVAPSPALARLSVLAERHGATVLLAVIPMLAEPALASALKGMPCLRPCQHGVWHRNHAPAGGKKSEFGPDRDRTAVDGEIAEGRDRLRDLIGGDIMPVFVPPWNRIDPGHAARLGSLGFSGLSCFRNYRHGPAGGPRLLNTRIDVMDWHGGRMGRRADDLLPEIVAQIIAMRGEGPDQAAALGLLLHHRDHDEGAWSVLHDILSLAAAHPAVHLADPAELLPARV